MRIYLDNCCFNRPFDDQTHFRIRIEAEAKLYVQDLVREGRLELAWSYMLDHENDANPFKERRESIESWKQLATRDVAQVPEVINLANGYVDIGVKPADSLHIACAIVADCEAFLTTDGQVLGKRNKVNEITIVDPPAFVREMIG